MEVVFGLLALGLVGLAMVGSLVGLFAWTRTSRWRSGSTSWPASCAFVRRSRGAAPAEAAEGAAPEPPPRRPGGRAAARRLPDPASRSRCGPAPRRRPFRRRLRGRARPRRRPIDFATNIGPKILVATGALAFMVFLGPVREVRLGQQLGGPGGARPDRRRLRPRAAGPRHADDAARVPPSRPGSRRGRARRALHLGLRRPRLLRPRSPRGLRRCSWWRSPRRRCCWRCASTRGCWPRWPGSAAT